ncbi:lipoprotein insertase outer membrane protein LolB [Blochmannia endosymbiont of Polyrhachis (Hedomyrma) turneri]|uniref:lipoprotein insertase outer membrane protein LolB n=1 Tax=Blochmannia endosymbiont of Polyrhachis (Hedomyrma) turneri TaxID=1505596 RepID=UPI00130E9A9F|nr:lipoprotein insertase outer membrane protein LolB [Blochmannia endosymbiont of Polyrhachis (Hedomyrma) turneri]
MHFVVNSCRYEKYFFNNCQNFNAWQKHRESLLKVKRYQIRGVITCAIFQTHWKRLSFVWQKVNDEHYKFIFIHPIGLESIEINILENKVCPVDDKSIKNCCTIDYFENIIQELLHLKISFKNFKAWIVGLPGHNECDFILNAKCCLEKVYCPCNSGNFTILYKSYYNSSCPMLPKVIEILCDKNYFFNIKIYNWKIQ